MCVLLVCVLLGCVYDGMLMAVQIRRRWLKSGSRNRVGSVAAGQRFRDSIIKRLQRKSAEVCVNL